MDHTSQQQQQQQQKKSSRLDYFKDNYQDPRELEDYDPNEYLYAPNYNGSANGQQHGGTQLNSGAAGAPQFSSAPGHQHAHQVPFNSAAQQAFSHQFSNMSLAGGNSGSMHDQQSRLMGSPPPSMPTGPRLSYNASLSQQQQQQQQQDHSTDHSSSSSSYGSSLPQYKNKSAMPGIPQRNSSYGASAAHFNSASNPSQQNRRAPYATIAAQHLAQQQQQQQQQMPSGLPGLQQHPMMQQGMHSTPPPQNQPKKRGFAVDEYGLLGILNVIRMLDKDHCALALGYDLTTLGLNLNSSLYLYSQFAAPWSQSEGKVTPHHKVPSVYTQLPVKDADYFEKFNEETLFYIFYSIPRDRMQLRAAEELCRRNWFFHHHEKMWFSKIASPDHRINYEKVTYNGEECEQGVFKVFNFDTFKIEKVSRAITIQYRYES